MTTTQTRPGPQVGSGPSIARTLGELVEPMFGGELPLRLRTPDGGEYGPEGAPVITISSPDALRRLLFHPGELGLAQAYVTGEIDVEGDVLDGFRRVWRTARERSVTPRPTPALLLQALRTARELGALGRPPVPPASQARLRGRLHSLGRDRQVIAHHYDLSNDFYALILDPHMAYSCGYWTSDDPFYTVQDAQRDKLDLVCRKLGLREGMRMLDIGCGWGSLTLYAAEHFGAKVLAVTLSAEQRAFVQARVDERGLADRVEVRLQDYREVPETGFDAITSIEMGEHVGKENYPVFTGLIHSRLKPGGRVLIQQMSRKGHHPGGGPFIEAFIAPDMWMRPVGETVGLLEQAGLEVRDVHVMREHYARTIHAWYATLERRWDDVVAMVGEEVARVWRLYMVGSALSFEENRMGVDQVLGVKPGADGVSGMPPVRTW
ncbi:MAG: class I SAM-dependent methyltransferase [Oryzihumus sp.]